MKKKNVKKLSISKSAISVLNVNSVRQIKGGSAFVCSNDCDTTTDTDTLGIPGTIIGCPYNPSYYPCENENRN
ncbi:hypothetical protein IMCC3317_27400 [Kordia antarctica]|uniref:Uncharacterized protein n=1 Tax=Kordia antarctica TaxID=1218801 RepID=A0A7L4ZLI2_9FLAO|nr:class I lanthipeptide [Kordia antarctica]QHI37361.1 hypothetical protein IMCC3317_27400 [Kordia antarctica]